MGKIFLNKLEVCAIIGTLPHERTARQRLFIDVELDTPFKAAAQSDDLTDALDYSAIENEVTSVVEKSSFQLLEALLNAVGNAVMAHREVSFCKIRIEKPAASRYGRSVALEAEFSPEGMCE
ncbi:MAG: dihydroneopterin aldolase [Lentisphaeria bacterium]|nr:dihydroneopterin aldolase [Lentisphaeria bacterium]